MDKLISQEAPLSSEDETNEGCISNKAKAIIFMNIWAITTVAAQYYSKIAEYEGVNFLDQVSFRFFIVLISAVV